MKRSIIVLVILILSIPLYAAFEWNSDEEGSTDFPGGSYSVPVTWNAADLEIPLKYDYWFEGNNVSDDKKTASIVPAFYDGKFIGYGTFDFCWTITSMENAELLLYISEQMKSASSDLDWMIELGDDGGNKIGASELGGAGYGEDHAVAVVTHNPSSGTIKSSGSIAIEARTGSIIDAPVESFSGIVYVWLKSGE